MGAQWKHAGQAANASKKGAMMGKMVKEITVAAKMGDANPDNNPRLRAAVESAKKQSVPRDTIERAIKKGAGLLEPVNYETSTYEGFTPHRVPVIVETLTDNVNRTVADIRVLFRKGQLGGQGAVSWMFDRLGVVEATLPEAGADIEGAAIEAGAQNVETLDAADVGAGQTGARFFCETTDLDAVSKALSAAGWVITQAEMSYIAKSKADVAPENRKEVEDFLSAIDDHDDVHRIYTAF